MVPIQVSGDSSSSSMTHPIALSNQDPVGRLFGEGLVHHFIVLSNGRRTPSEERVILFLGNLGEDGAVCVSNPTAG